MGCCVSNKVQHAFIPPFKLVILSVRDLPDEDQSLRKDDLTDPYVRIRFTEIEGGKELKKLARKTKAIVDADEANFFELFSFREVPHYGLLLHLEVLDKDFHTRDDFIGSTTIQLGQKNDKGEYVPAIDFNEYTSENPLFGKTKSTNQVVVNNLAKGSGEKGFIKFRITVSNDVTVRLTES